MKPGICKTFHHLAFRLQAGYYRIKIDELQSAVFHVFATGECCKNRVCYFTGENRKIRIVIDEQTIMKAVNLLLDAAPGSKVILFGSYARGQADARSDLDLLVIEPEVKNRFKEMSRLAEILRPLLLPVDVLVVSEEKFDYWRDTPNTVYYRAVKEGKVYEQVA